ncbi:putative gag-pol polyprotein [Cucumis melo var. makuwa]|uniref:Putative gag-pol polyprotein n=1 Tax=Cucumis melo var. makuwa TaxID=1194695 RepID=A0A5D3BBW5_CUCMM|nr:putative gag-pol polyprotein [Cucumis melo var. makuwa]
MARVMIYIKICPLTSGLKLETPFVIYTTGDHHRKWDSKSDRGIFLGYSTNSRAYRVYNQCIRIVMESVMESIHVIIDDHGKALKGSPDEEDGDI